MGWIIAGLAIVIAIALFAIFGGDVLSIIPGFVDVVIFGVDVFAIGVFIIFWALFPQSTSVFTAAMLGIVILIYFFRIGMKVVQG